MFDYLEIIDCVITAPREDSDIFPRIRPDIESQIQTQFLVSAYTLVLENIFRRILTLKVKGKNIIFIN